MDERAYRDAYNAVNPLACPFEKAILICQCDCREARRVNIAERLTVNCLAARAQSDCSLLLELLRRNSAFALKLTHADEVLPHAKYVKVQCGGLLGLQATLQPEQADAPQVDDIRGLVLEARERFGSLEDLPYNEIVRGIAGFQVRKRSGPK
ncbi:MAG: hypothetical protein ACM3JK_02715 [Betaproteobacteria bacterium]